MTASATGAIDIGATADGVEVVTPPTPTLRPIGRDAVIYGIGNVMRRAASLVMLPVYTRLLTPRDYGLLQMLDMTVDVAAILMSAGMTAGVMRFYFKATTERARREVVVTATWLVLSLNAAGAILLSLGAGPIHEHILGGAGASFYVYIAAANFALGQLLTMPMLLMQIQGRAKLFSIVSIVQLVSQLSINILLLVVFHLGPLGILVSTLVTNIVVGGAASVWMLRQVGVKPSGKALRDLRRFGVPYQAATAATFVLQFGDRFFLEAHRGLAAVGLYALAYQFAFLVDQVGTGPFMRAWQPRRFANLRASREIRERDDNVALHALTITVVSVCLGEVLFVRLGLRLIAGPAFFGAAGLVPFVVAAFVFQAWGTVVQFGIDAAEKTRYNAVVMWVSAALILVLYAVLIPPYGAYGAGLATLISFAFRTALLSYFSNRVWPHTYDWLPQLRVFAAAVVIGAISWIAPARGLGDEASLGALLYGVWLTYLWYFELSAATRQTGRARISEFGARMRPRLVEPWS
jgi:O-antigen/teichoic acid export membrane protein